MTLSSNEKLTIRRQAVADADYARGRASATRLLRGGAILPSAMALMRLGDLGDGDDGSEGELVATFSKEHSARRRPDGRLDIFKED